MYYRNRARAAVTGLWLLIGGAWAAPQGASPIPAASRPNIVFILADDLGVNDLACYGRLEHHTPNLDRLASEGARFTAAYCAQPICSPSRAALLTGFHPARLHLTTYLPGRPDASSQKLLHPVIRQQLPLERKTLAEFLREAGYATACIGKWHLGGEGFGPLEQGFDYYHPGKAVTEPSETEGGKGEYDLTAQAIRFMEGHREAPFFVYLAHNSPHIPYAAKADFLARNRDALEPVYAAVIETLDDTVGRLLAGLDSLGLADRTIVVFTSDNGGLHVPEGPHGTVTHNSPFRAGKGFLYEGGLRVPLLVRWPRGVPAGRILKDPVVNTGWLPTLLELAGLPAPSGLDGRSFAKLLTGRGSAPSAEFYFHFPHYNNQGGRPAGAVREKAWKLIEYYDDGRVELFNLERDPEERTDLARSETAVVGRLRNKLTAWRKSVGTQENTVNPGFDPLLYRDLYVDIDVSRYNASTADPAARARVQAWRKAMNRAVAKK